jgi:predicted nucleic acid-binding protein
MEFVFDASTLILLAKTEILRVAVKNFQVTIPETVMKECTGKNLDDAKLIGALIDSGMIPVVKLSNKKNVTKIRKDFKTHIGEAEALSLAFEKKYSVATDDLLAIKACKVLNIPFATSIHFLINLTEKGKLDRKTALLKLEKLSAFARYDQRIIDDASMRLKGGV